MRTSKLCGQCLVMMFFGFALAFAFEGRWPVNRFFGGGREARQNRTANPKKAAPTNARAADSPKTAAKPTNRWPPSALPFRARSLKEAKNIAPTPIAAHNIAIALPKSRNNRITILSGEKRLAEHAPLLWEANADSRKHRYIGKSRRVPRFVHHNRASTPRTSSTLKISDITTGALPAL